MLELIELCEQQLVFWGLNQFLALIVVRLALIVIVFALSVLANQIAKRYILKSLSFVAGKTSTQWDDVLLEKNVFNRLANLAPALVIYACAALVFAKEPLLFEIVRRLAAAYMIVITCFVVDALLDAGIVIYRSYELSKRRPIKAYIQVLKIAVFIVGAIFVISVLFKKSPWGLLSGLGAMTAVLMLVFKDSILGFVASIQLAAHDMVRHGDWIEMPSYGADGDVIDVTLNTVKVQNWDKTISTIPTYALISNSFKNWRGMSESGGRRIKRSLAIDMSSIHFCSEEELERYAKVQLLQDYIEGKQEEIRDFNQSNSVDQSSPVNGRCQTNVGVFRAYVEAYLRNHPKIHKSMTFLVRQLPPGEKGLPIELYVFSNDQVWANYEAIQADIFDHILAVLPEFGLRVFQNPSGGDFQKLSNE